MLLSEQFKKLLFKKKLFINFFKTIRGVKK